MADNELDLLNTAQTSGIPALPVLDTAKYLPLVSDLDLSESQKIEFLETLWHIMAAFVRIGFSVDSVVPAFQKALELPAPDTLELVIPNHDFNIASKDEAKKAEPPCTIRNEP